MNLPEQFIHQATRYVLGRQTYAVLAHCRWLIANWQSIPESERATIQRDVEAEFDRDDFERAAHPDNYSWTHCADMDRWEWEQVRKLWRDK